MFLVAPTGAAAAATTTVVAGAGGGGSAAAPAAPAAPVNPAAPAAPAAPVNPASATPATPTTVSTAATPTTAAVAPAPPTTTGTATTTATTATTTATTTAPNATTAAPSAPAALTFGTPSTQWKVALAPPPPVGYQNVQACADEDPRSDECKRYFDLPKSVVITFGVNNGAVAGQARHSNIEKEIVVSGSMKLGETTRITAILMNRSTPENTYEFTGTAGPGCTFSGSYKYVKDGGGNPKGDIGGGQSELFTSPGNCSMSYQGNDCPG